ncbi:MAG: glycosyl transferase [Lachnospiraceae bacterium]|nr:glycosyl transferase [Lachnospiraceae bacterium]
MYIRLMYYFKLGKKCDLKNPKTFDEKLNYLKLYDRRPEYTMMADKYAVREYIKEKIGEEYLIPLLGVWNRPEEIDFDALPDEFVLKCTHDSASVVICRDKKGFDREAAVKKLRGSMNVNYFYPCREWPYKNIVPRVIAEKYMTDESATELKDYKFYCFDGHVELIQVDFGRFVHHERNLYDTGWNYIDKQIEYPKNPSHMIDKPERLDKMLELASLLSKGIPSVRIDFYSIRDRIYFGEITFYQEGGFAYFEPEEYALELGKCIKLP